MPERLRNAILTFVSLLLLISLDAQADGLDQILKKGTLRVGVSLFTPWTIQDKAGALSGYEIDVTGKLAQDMGVKPEYHVYVWEDIIPALMRGEIDIIAGGMAITPARALKVNFSSGYADSGISLITNTKKTQDINDFSGLNKKEINIAVVSRTASEELSGQLFDQSTVRAFESADEAKAAILSGDVHAWLASSPQPEFLLLQHPEMVDMPLSKPLMSYKAGFAVQKGEQELLNFLNAWVTARQADKWLDATHKHWFNSLDWAKDSLK
ncbi:MAG: transporter substrate-binding domain-containing protein [Candidatus Thiodiazotropha sp.]